MSSSSTGFFFQAEDGIRVHCVTGVQTCALPICCAVCAFTEANEACVSFVGQAADAGDAVVFAHLVGIVGVTAASPGGSRSEERRVGKECRSGLTQTQ